MAEKILNVCNEVCPMPIVKTREALKEMKPGETLVVIVDYPPSKENVQRFAINEGHEILGVSNDDRTIKIIIKKK
jgi:tRNA 2-thiouridine synthesizing protein A